MTWVNPFLLAEMHRETYVAILKSRIPHGERGKFARRVGITQEYLSFLCALDHPAEDIFPTKRLPSPSLVRKMAEALPAPLEVRQSLVENMELAHAHSVKAHYKIKASISRRQVGEILSELERNHYRATYGADLAEVQRAYRMVRDAAASLVTRLSPDIYPGSLAQACLYLHDAQCVLDRPEDALRFAKLSRLIIENTDIFEADFSKEQIDHQEINAIRGEGVAYHNLGLDRQAQLIFARTRTLSAYSNSRDFWEPLVGRDLLNAMARTPRFSIRKATEIASNIEEICMRKGDEFTLLIARESWLRCLIQREKWTQAQRVFEEEIERIPHLPYIGSLHRALLLKTGALLAWKLNDRTAWRERVGEALTIMHQAGLSHQIRTVKQFYGQDLRPLFETLDLPY